jgi:hypothetical protein
MESAAQLLELDHAIGYNGSNLNTLHYHPSFKDTFVYNVGGLVIIESTQDNHNQKFLRGHDMPITSLIISNSGIFIHIHLLCIYPHQYITHQIPSFFNPILL